MPEIDQPRRRVLLIGIDKYPSSMSSLRGCVNDVDAMELFLRERKHVPADAIRKLASPHPRPRPAGLVAEQPPTRKAILDALAALRDEAQPDDRILVFYSGHGTQRPQSGFVIEGLVPVDSPSRGDVWDFELNPLLASIAAKGADLTVILDCCQSAGATRALAESEGADRYIETTGPLPPAPANIVARRGLVDVGSAAAPPFVVVAACQSDEKAKEQPAGANDARGVFSSHLLEILAELEQRDGAERLDALRWGDIWDGLRGTVTERSPAQHPWLIGRSERRVFGGPWHEEDIGISVRRDGAVYRLGAGTMASVAPGAIVAVYGRANLIARADAPGEPRFFPPVADAAARALTLEVTAAGAGWAEATLRDGGPELPEGARARVIVPAAGDELVVQLRPYDQALATWLEAQRDVAPGSARPLFKTVARGDGAAEAYLDVDDNRVALGDAIHGSGGEPPLATVDRRDDLLVALRHFAHYNLVFRLLARCNSPDLANALVVRLRDCSDAAAVAQQNVHNPVGLPELPRDALPAPGAQPRFTYRVPDGQSACITVTNTSRTSLYVTVFDCPSSGRVQVIGANVQIPAGNTDTFWWQGVQRRPIGFWIGPRGAMVERFIVVGTTNPAARLDGLESKASFADVLAAARGDRDSGPPDLGTPADPRESWTAAQVSLKLEPRVSPAGVGGGPANVARGLRISASTPSAGADRGGSRMSTIEPATRSPTMTQDKPNEESRGLCIDRQVPDELAEEAAYMAALENPENDRENAADPLGNDRLALLKAKKWMPGRTLRVRFLDGSATMRDKVARYAKTWCDYANIKLAFGNYKSAHIRISFYADRGSWSALGTDALVRSWFPTNQPTMNYGWLRDDTPDDEYSRVVIHEFGHALGAIHEHQNPLGVPLNWNKEAVYDYFSGPPNYWSKDQIDFNILDRYSVDQLQGSDFDPDSIMLYGFPDWLMLDGKGTKSNSVLSAVDIETIRTAYPR